MTEYKVKKALGYTLYASSVLLISLAAGLALFDLQQRTVLSVRDSLQTVLATVQKANQILVRESQNTINHISELTRIIELTEQTLSDRDIRANGQRLSDAIAIELSHHQNKEFYVVRHDGVNIAASDPSLIDRWNAIHKVDPLVPARLFARKGPAISLIRLPGEILNTFTPSAYISSIIRSSAGEPLAAFIKVIDPKDQFANISVLGRIGESGETYAFDKNALLLTDSRFEHHLVTTNLIPVGRDSMMNLFITDPGGNMLEGFKPKHSNADLPKTLMAKQATAGVSGFDLSGYRDYRGVKVFGAWLWDTELGIGLASEINVDEALRPYYRTRNTFISVIIFGLIVGLIVLRVIFNLMRKSNERIRKDNELLEGLVEERTKELVEAQSELSEKNVRLEVMATTDELTQLANRRKFSLELAHTWQRNLRDDKSIALILLDIDSFKEYNDNYGHLEGDACLTQVASILQNSQINKRPGDLIARYGGEEFIVILDNPTHEYANQVAQRICFDIRSYGLEHKFSKVHNSMIVTVSVGLFYIDELKSCSLREAIGKADAALYKAKESGRDRVVEYDHSLGNVVAISRNQPEA